jgi:hypothetical protein
MNDEVAIAIVVQDMCMRWIESVVIACFIRKAQSVGVDMT